MAEEYVSDVVATGIVANGTLSADFVPLTEMASKIPDGAKNIRYTVQLSSYWGYIGAEINISNPTNTYEVLFSSTRKKVGDGEYDAYHNCALYNNTEGTLLDSAQTYTGDGWPNGYAAATIRAYYTLFSIPVNIGGGWKDCDAGFVNVNGVWKSISEIFVNINGVWKPKA